jgi:hypothetical protein
LADVADKICFGRTKKFGIGIEFSAVQWRLFPLWTSVVCGWAPLKEIFFFLQFVFLKCLFNSNKKVMNISYNQTYSCDM